MKRGMIKWKPFYSITGLDELVNRINEENSLIEKPVISEDKLADLNLIIISIIENNQSAKYYYFKNRKILTIEGYIKKIDKINKYIIINESKINITDIIDINI